jgi:hypothetical protein
MAPEYVLTVLSTFGFYVCISSIRIYTKFSPLLCVLVYIADFFSQGSCAMLRLCCELAFSLFEWYLHRYVWDMVLWSYVFLSQSERFKMVCILPVSRTFFFLVSERKKSCIVWPKPQIRPKCEFDNGQWTILARKRNLEGGSYMVIFLWLHKNKILKEDPSPWPFQRNGIYSVYIVSSKGRLEEQSSRMHHEESATCALWSIWHFSWKVLTKIMPPKISIFWWMALHNFADLFWWKNATSFFLIPTTRLQLFCKAAHEQYAHTWHLPPVIVHISQIESVSRYI